MDWYIKYKRKNLEKLQDIDGLSPLERVLLANRDVVEEKELRSFLNPSLDDLHDPFLFEDMEIAVEYILECFYGQIPIRIVGDYDQDGVASTTILVKALRRIARQMNLDPYAMISYTIPDRIEDGYGINENIINKALQEQIGLLITCDNGIAAFEALDYAFEKQIPVIITDHHQISIQDDKEVFPKAEAILNPHKRNTTYPFADLAGAGVSYKLVEGLCIKLFQDKNKYVDLLSFAALGTICDVVPLKGENRVIASLGLKEINKRDNPGLNALLVLNSWDREVTSYTVGFVIGPCINASGRLFTARLGVELFLETEEETLYQYARELVSLNDERKEMTRLGIERAQAMIMENKLPAIILIYLQDCHESICGLIAGRIKESFHRPTLIFTDANEEGVVKGSGRSIEAYNMYENMKIHDDLYLHFGGHEMACGLSMKKEHLFMLNERLNQNHQLEEKDFKNYLEMDMPLNFDRLDYFTLQTIDRFAPFGKDNPRPLFATKNCNVLWIRLVGQKKNVLQMGLEKEGRNFTGVFFKAEEKLLELRKVLGPSLDLALKGQERGLVFDICYLPQENVFQGRKSIQLILKDLRLSH